MSIITPLFISIFDQEKRKIWHDILKICQDIRKKYKNKKNKTRHYTCLLKTGYGILRILNFDWLTTLVYKVTYL